MERGVAKIKIHKYYDESTTNNDIALIKLDKKVRLSPNIRTVCLPERRDFTGFTAVAAGWGHTRSAIGEYRHQNKSCPEIILRTK